MGSLWLTIYLVLLGMAVIQSLVLVVQTWEHRRYVRSCTRRLERHQPTGRAAVFVPCKGMDVELEGNLRPLLEQDYRDYELTFVVESGDDPACAVIRRLMAQYPLVATRLVVAGRSTHSGQKVHNLLAATASLSPEVAYLAFVDSDARPRPEWLRILVHRLSESAVGAVTGYRWFVPARDSLSNHLAYSINCGLMSLLGRSSHYLVWGGSWAIRREVFDQIGLRQAWQGTLSDDFVASRTLRRARLKVRFEPVALVGSPLDCAPRQMFAFLRRQYLVTRFYAPDWWAFAVAATSLTNLVWLGNAAVLVAGLVHRSGVAWLAASALALLWLLAVARGWLRQDLRATCVPDRQQTLRRAARFDVWANPLAGLVHWTAILGSCFGRHIAWRGIRYRLGPGGQILAVQRQHESQPPLADVQEENTREENQTVGFPATALTRYKKAG